METVIVVGSGVAGLTTALTLARSGTAVQVLTQDALGESNSSYAQGGMAAVLGAGLRTPGDSVACHAADTVAAGAGLSDAGTAEWVCGAGADSVRFFTDVQVAFDGDPHSPEHSGHPALGTEAAHSFARVLHINGDATGAALVAGLRRAALAHPLISVAENAQFLSLLGRAGTVSGVRYLVGGIEHDQLGPVVMATGGGGALFEATSNSAGAVGGGLAAAYQAGALLADLEFFQFHPTVFPARPEQPAFLISEAVRGEGATLLDAHGHRFMASAHERAELAPRDVVARAVQAAGSAFLDVRHLAQRMDLSQRFPSISAALRARGIDWTRELVPVQAGAHYWMGGIATDTAGRTSLAGLWAAGEAACTGLHGANRLASNSLLEAVVTGRAVARSVRTGVRGPGKLPRPDRLLALEPGNEPVDLTVLRSVMSEHVGVRRNRLGLRLAAKTLREFSGPTALAAALLVDSALAREGSVGAHWRDDFPDVTGGKRMFVMKEGAFGG